METGIKVMDAMTVNPVVADKELSLRECAKLMLKKGVGSIIVVEGSRILGIVTEKDFIEKVIAKKKDPSSIKLKQIMTKRIRAIEPNADLYKAILKMREKGIKKLPVLVGRELVGMLTMNDIIRVQPNLLDYLIEKFHVREMRMMNNKKDDKKEKYREGHCESCGDYAQLYEVDGQLICEDCKDEQGKL